MGSSVTSLLAAPLADKYGRRITLRAGAIIFTIGGAIQTLCTGYMVMIIGRITSGFGVGMLSMIVPIYQARFAILCDRLS
jgi:MFS family permease